MQLLRVVLLVWITVAGAKAASILGANGVRVEFAGIFEVTPAGMIAVVEKQKRAIIVPWERIDMEKLAFEHPFVFSQYQKMQSTRASQPIRIGIAEKALTPDQFRVAMKAALRPTAFFPYRIRTTETAEGEYGAYSKTRFSGESVFAETSPVVLSPAVAKASEESERAGAEGLLMVTGGMGSCLDEALKQAPPEELFSMPADLKRMRAAGAALVAARNRAQAAVNEAARQKRAAQVREEQAWQKKINDPDRKLGDPLPPIPSPMMRDKGPVLPAPPELVGAIKTFVEAVLEAERNAAGADVTTR